MLTHGNQAWQGCCCPCFYQQEKERSQEYLSREKVFADKQKVWKAKIQQLKLLRDYQGCKRCEGKEVDAYELYENNNLICWSCLVQKTGGASSPLSWKEQSQWYQKRWGWWVIK